MLWPLSSKIQFTGWNLFYLNYLFTNLMTTLDMISLSVLLRMFFLFQFTIFLLIITEYDFILVMLLWRLMEEFGGKEWDLSLRYNILNKPLTNWKRNNKGNFRIKFFSNKIMLCGVVANIMIILFCAKGLNFTFCHLIDDRKRPDKISIESLNLTMT